MNTPTRPAVDVDTAVARADRTWCRERMDDPLDVERREHLAAAVHELLGAPAATVDDATAADLEILRAAATKFDQRLDDLRTELWKHIKVQERRAERAETERDQLRAQLAEAQQQANTWEREYRRVVDDALVEMTEAWEQRDQARAERARHRHAWEWQPGLQTMPLPCSCGRPWPRTTPPDKRVTS